MEQSKRLFKVNLGMISKIKLRFSSAIVSVSETLLG